MGGLEQKAIQLNRTRRRRTRWGAGLGLLVLVILVVTAVGMQLPAFTQRKATYCGMDEDAGHTHELACYSNPEADVETEQDWVASLPQTLPEDGRERLVEVARSQLGYRESEDNYAVIEDDDVAGYTRYGAWDGAPYEPWNAAFARFCMHYAGVGEELGLAGDDAAAWMDKLREQDRLADAATYADYVQPGELAFVQDDMGVVLVGIVTGVPGDESQFELVAGDAGGEVRELRLAATDTHLLGFGWPWDELVPTDTVPASAGDQTGEATKPADDYGSEDELVEEADESPRAAEPLSKRAMSVSAVRAQSAAVRITFNVNDSVGGCVYERSANYGSSIQLGVTNGVVAGSVRPRSADDATNSRLHATSGYRFVGWRVDGYTDYGMGSLNTDNKEANLYYIQPAIDMTNRSVGPTFTACFAPENQCLITFAPDVVTGSGVTSTGYVERGNAGVYDYVDANGTSREVYYCYSGASYGAVAVPGTDSKFTGWYRTDTDELVCGTNWFVPPSGLDKDITVQAHFEKAASYTVTYRSYYTVGGNEYDGGLITITGAGNTPASTVEETVYEHHSPSGATVADRTGQVFIGWRKDKGNSSFLTRDHELTGLDAVTGNITYYAEFVRAGTARVLFSTNDENAGHILGGTKNVTNQWLSINNDSPNNAVVKDDGLTFPYDCTAEASQGYRFYYWTINGQTVYDESGNVYTNATIPKGKKILPADSASSIQELQAVFIPLTTITLDLGVIQQVGNNTPDWQHWQDVPWCSSEVELQSAEGFTRVTEDDSDHYQLTLDYGGTFTLPSLVPNSPNGEDTLRVSQTDNKYNLLTHTFKGWRAVGDDRILPPGTTVQAFSPWTYEAVWDAYFPSKTGAYSSSNSERAYRYNTNTCGFFVRLYDSTFDIGNVNTYTDCLFTSRIMLSGSGSFATDSSVNGQRIDFYGDSDTNDRNEVEVIDANLRSLANAGIAYSEQYSEQDNSAAFDGATITFEQPFPSDEYMFARLREWNAAASDDKKITINGNVIPQDHLTTDYFDLRWYVLKDQENSWHVDGMLIPKYAKLVVRKRFEGVPEAVAAAKARSDFYIGVDKSKDATENDNKSEEYKLRLHEWSANDEKSNYGYYAIEDGEYVWVLDTLDPLATYWVGEHGYIAREPYITTKSIHIDNTSQSKTDITNSFRAEVEKVESYPDGTTVNEIQSVAFTNRYTKPRQLMIAKLDATTNKPLASVPFDFTLYVPVGSEIVAMTLSLETDESGTLLIDIPQVYDYEGRHLSIPDDTYRFSVTEGAHEGYQALPGPITGSVALSSSLPTDIELDSSVTGNARFSGLVELVETDNKVDAKKFKTILYINNKPSTTRVEVTKGWTNNATIPVTMQLLRNGIAVSGKSVQLSAANGWRYAWEDLPAYVNGAEAVYTVREEWIGEPGGTDSVHYNANADTDGYEDYLVNQTQTVTTQNGSTLVSVYVENTPYAGQVVFSKVDDSQRAVPGAEFTVYTDQYCTVPITASNYVKGTSSSRPAVFTSNANGIVSIEGLYAGTYYMRETRVPSGYTAESTRVYTLTIGSKTSTITLVDASTREEVAVSKVTNPVYTRRVTLHKVVAGTTRALEGATFSLHGQLATGEMDPTPLRGYGSLITGANGDVSLGDLKKGVYYLVEEQAPAGFNLLESPVRITVPGDDSTSVTAIKTVSNTALPVNGGTITVSNSEGVVLPASGGSGTGLLYACGLALLFVAGGALGVRKRVRMGGDGHE